MTDADKELYSFLIFSKQEAYGILAMCAIYGSSPVPRAFYSGICDEISASKLRYRVSRRSQRKLLRKHAANNFVDRDDRDTCRILRLSLKRRYTVRKLN